MAFEVMKDLREAELQKLPVSTFTGTKGDLIERVAAAVSWTACTATSDWFTPKAILMETVASASSVLAYRINGMETVKADCTNVSDATHNGDLMVLSNTSTVNNTGTSSTTQYAAFVQENTSGATTAKKLIGRILVGNGVDPDATV